MSEVMIKCRDLTRCYQRGKETLTVLENIDLSIQRGEFVSLMGPSGSGKSTLLNLIGGLDRPTAGSISIQDVDITTLSSRTLADWRAATVGYVFQFYHLLPVLSAQANVELPLLLTPLTRAQRRTNAQTALDVVGLGDRAQHRPAELSGGQQQRVAIARAIVTDAQLLVCDEPTGDLDRDSADEILKLLTTLNADFGKTILMVTHDPKAAAQASRQLSMDKGSLSAVAA